MSLQLIQYLQYIGLSEKEIQVYTYLLSVDTAFPVVIARATHIKRSTVYVILELLKEKGMVREITQGKRCSYQAEDVERIKFYLEEQKLKTEEYIKGLDKVLPQLKATLRKKGQSPVIKFYEGEHAVQESMQELVSHPKFKTHLDYGVFSLELINKLFKNKNLSRFFNHKITENKLFKVLYTAEEGILATNKEYNQEAILVNGKEFPLSCDISVFEDEVRFHMLGDTVYGILIKNPELAETLSSLIKLAMKNNS
jgi:sugar-specific transcriptional regulator TrmB